MKKYRGYHKFLPPQYLVPKRFRKILIKEDLLYKFLFNVFEQNPDGRRGLIEMYNEPNFESYIGAAFIWCQTREGTKLWDYVSTHHR